MADEKKDEKPEVATYPVERLIEEAQDFLGVPSHVAAGGLHSTRKKELSVEEAKKAVASWLKSEV